MFICIDIGNTRTKVALFEQDELLELTHFEALDENFKAFLTNLNPSACIYSSVNQALPVETEHYLIKKGPLIALDQHTELPFTNAYESPATLGKDRLAGVAGGLALYPGENLLIVDAGTCITYDPLRSDGLYTGGNIAPGWRMRLAAMKHFTARLPEPVQEVPDGWLGKDTESALQHGAAQGIAFEIAGYIARLSAEWGTLRPVLCGGDAPHLAKLLKKEIFVHPNLVLRGLNKILQYNVQ